MSHKDYSCEMDWMKVVSSIIICFLISCVLVFWSLTIFNPLTDAETTNKNLTLKEEDW